MLSPVESSVTTVQRICIDFFFSFLFNYMARFQVEPDLIASPGRYADFNCLLPKTSDRFQAKLQLYVVPKR